MDPPGRLAASWQRHDLLRVHPPAWVRVLQMRPDLAANPRVARWAELGRPLIVRRYMAQDDRKLLPVALALPPACGKLRVGTQVPSNGVIERVPPQTLREAEGETPRSWRATVKLLLQIADETGVEPRLFGSLLWQRLTGLPYLSSASDLDLLWPAPDRGCANRLVHGLASAESAAPMRCDGEIILPDGGGVNWRELHRNPSEVLVKTLLTAQLRPVKGLFDSPAPWAPSFGK